MSQNEFSDFALLLKEKFTWRKVNADKNKFLWNQVKWLRFTKKSFGKVFYKTSLNENEEFKILNMQRRGINSVTENDLKKAYVRDVPISSKKKKDLIDMLPLIDNCYHDFYKNIVTEDGMLDFHPDLTENDFNED